MKIQLVATPPKAESARIAFCHSKDPSSQRESVGEIRVTENPSGSAGHSRLDLAVSIGRKDDRNADCLRRAGGIAGKWLVDHRVEQATVDLATVPGRLTPDKTRAVCEGLLLGGFQFLRHKSSGNTAKDITIHLLREGPSTQLATAVRQAKVIAECTNLAREWGHEPPNVINPVTLADRVCALSRQHKLKCKIFDENRLARMKAGGLLAVGVGSETPPRLIVMEYPGSGKSGNRKPIVLVGKAVTFDTGGYSLKDKTGIVGMKYDKCGGMAVIGAMRAMALLKPKVPVIGIIPAAENMIAGNAYRPNDIITTMSGMTVEIISTDAEGRMILADALTFAQEAYKPRAVIDLATLTGGVVVALGAVRAGIFSNDDKLAGSLIDAGDRVHERLWRLPLDDDYLELIKGDDSDLRNSAGRHAHPIIGGIFLQQFVRDGTPWAHLDIAGVGSNEKDQPYCPKGATGFGVRLLVDYIMRLR